MKDRKLPLRKCIVSQEMRPKKELIRIVRSKEGEVSLDPTGKKPGRGAYISKDISLIQKAKDKNVLARHLKTEISDSVYEELFSTIKEGS